MEDDDVMSEASFSSMQQAGGSLHENLASQLARARSGFRADFSHDALDGGDGTKKGERKAVRELQHTDPIGYAYRQKSVGDLLQSPPAYYLYFLRLLRTPWVNRPRNPGFANMGPNGCGDYSTYVGDQRKMLAFAQRFAVPFFADDLPEECYPYDSKLLHFLTLTHPNTHLTAARAKEVRKVTFPQFEGDIGSSVMLHGHEGGLVGVPDFTCFFMLRGNELRQASPDDIIKLITALSMGLGMTYSNGGKTSVGVNTDHTELFAQQNGRADSARMIAKKNFYAATTAMQYDMHDELDQTLLGKLADYLNVEGHMDVVHTHQKLIKCKFGSKMKESDELACPITFRGLFEFFLRTEVVPCVDEDGKERSVKLDAIYIRSKVPGVEPLLAIEQMCSAVPESKDVLMRVIKHMSQILYGHCNVSLDTLFSVGGKSLDIVALTNEGNIPLAISIFARKIGACDANIGGLNIDTDDESEMQAYKEMLDMTSAARRMHYDKLSTQTKYDAKHGKRSAEKPMEGYDMAGCVNFHFRYISTKQLQTEISLVKQDLKSTEAPDYEEWSRHFDDEWRSWIGEQLISDDGMTVYFMAGGGLLNSGAVLHIDYESFTTPTLVQQRDRKSLENLMPQPAKACRAVQLYLSAAPAHQMLRAMWEEESLIPSLEFFKSATDSLPVSIMRLYMAMESEMTLQQLQSMLESQQQSEEVLGAWGMTPHPLQKTLSAMAARCKPEKLAVMYHTTFEAGVQQVMDEFVLSRIKQQRLLGEVFCDLEHVQEVRYSMHYVEQVVRFRENGKNLGEDATTAWFLQKGIHDLDLRIAFVNEINVQSIVMANIAIFGYHFLGKVWGYCISVSDGGRSFHVLGTSAKKRGRDVLMINKKSPGAGGDLAKEQESMRHQAYISFLLADEEMKIENLDLMSMDVSAKKCSPMSMTTWLGSGVELNERGVVNINQTPFLQQAGVSGVFTELLKYPTDPELITQMETLMGHSSRGKYIRETGWTTTEGQRQKNAMPTMVLPVTVMCQNTNNDKEPPSMIEGGRIKSVLSGSLDSAGRVETNVAMDTCDFESLTQYDKREDEKTAARSIDDETGRKHRALLLVNYLFRRLPYLQRALTLETRTLSCTLTSSPDQVKNYICDITTGLRRSFMRKSEIFSRNYDGALMTSTLFPMHFQMTVTRNVLWACANPTRERSGNKRARLNEAIAKSMYALRDTVPGLLTVLSAVFTWIFQCVMDANMMILSCYHLHRLDFRQYCPLPVLAKAVLDMELSEKESKQYDDFCSWLAPLVLVPGDGGTVEKRSSSKKGKSLDKDGFPGPPVGVQNWKRFEHKGLVGSASLETPSKKTLEKWFSFEEDQNQNEILGMASAMKQRHSASFYLHSGDPVIASKKPHILKSKMERSDEEIIDTYTGKDPEDILADAFAANQEDREDFWRAAQEGARLPGKTEESGDNKAFSFESAHTTGYFYQRNLKAMAVGGNGMIFAFLKMCRFSPKCSRSDVVEAILKRFLRQWQHPWRVPKTVAWVEPILKNGGDGWLQTYRPAMRLSSKPSTKGGTANGVEIDLVVDVLWAIVSNPYAREWKETSIVHTKNMAHLSLAAVELIMHNDLEFSGIPAGKLILTTPSPILGQVAPVLNLYPELHIDKLRRGTESNNLLPDRWNALCLRMRRPRNFTCTEIRVSSVEDDNRNLTMATFISMKNNVYVPSATNLSDVVPYPPESFAYMQNFMPLIMRAMTSLYRHEPTFTPNDILFALQLYGSTMTSEMQTHLYTSATFSALESEIPIFVTGYNYLCVVHRVPESGENDEELLEVVTVTPTHGVERAKSDFDTTCLALPLKRNVQFSFSDFNYALCGGLRVKNEKVRWYPPLSQNDDEEIHDLREIDTREAKEMEEENKFKILNCVPFPIVRWRHLVRLSMEDFVATTTDHEEVRILHVGTWLVRFSSRIMTADTKVKTVDKETNEDLERSWLDVYDSESMARVRSSLLIVCFDDHEKTQELDPFGENTRFVVCLDSDGKLANCADIPTTIIEAVNHDGTFVFFNNQAHLIDTLKSNDGFVLSEMEQETWHYQTLAVVEQLHFNAHDWRSFNLFRLHKISGKLQSPVLRYKAQNAEQLRQDAKEADERMGKLDLQLKRMRRSRENRRHNNDDMTVLDRRIDDLESVEAKLKDIVRDRWALVRDAKAELVVIRPRVFDEENILRRQQVDPPLIGKPAKLGMVVERRGREFCPFLKNGHNRVASRPDGTKLVYSAFDFAAISRCIVPEGSALYIIMTPTRYSKIVSLLGARFKNEVLHNTTLSKKQESVIFLRGFYVLGHPTLKAEDLSSQEYLAVRVLLNIRKGSSVYKEIVTVCIWENSEDGDWEEVFLTEEDFSMDPRSENATVETELVLRDSMWRKRASEIEDSTIAEDFLAV